MLNQEIKIFFAALTFFTRIPSPLSSDTHDEDLLNRAAKYFPLIGWIVGGICALVLWLAGYLLPVSISIVLSIIAGILVTGAFHEDGFADTCDGFGGGWTKERILDIMKDSRIGSYGAIGLVMILLSKYLLLSEILFHSLPFIIIAAHSISRLMSTHYIYTHQYVGNQATSKAKPLCSEISTKEMVIATILGFIPLFFLGSYWYTLSIIPVFISKWWMARYFKKWIGGYTGDCLGAIQQVSEIVFYVSVIVLKNNFL
jgi:adenosylcobinamide-GDP ribazoletransferase